MKIALDKGAYMPVRAHCTDAGLDLRTPVDVTVPAHGSAVINTGVRVQIPQDCAGLLVSKSGLNVRHGVTTTGLIDEGYTGPIVAKAYNDSDADAHFDAGDKITQLVIIPVRYVAVEVVEAIDGGERGAAGFGSTGA